MPTRLKLNINILTKFHVKFSSRNLRLFLSLLFMETQLPDNFTIVSKIKGQALQLGIFEAFLEAGPQAILQMSIILRTGTYSKYFLSLFFIVGPP